MKGQGYTWPFPALLFLSILLFTSCQLQPTLQSGYDIPPGKMLQREVTYDDPIDTPGGVAYISGGQCPGCPVFTTKVKSTSIDLGDNVTIYYRDNIETKAGQFRINIVNIIMIFHKFDSWGNHKVDLKLVNPPGDIQVKNIGVSVVGRYSIVLMIVIPPQVWPGDYKMGFLVFVDDKYCGELPCTIHVIK